MSYACKTLITTANELASRGKRLSICLEAGGFSFAEVTSNRQLVKFGQVEGSHALTMTGVMTDVKALFAEVGIRPLGYAQMELVVPSDVSTWVPDELYSSMSNRQYIQLVGGSTEALMTCHSAQLASTAVFAANEQVVTAFKVAMPGVAVMHQHAKLSQLASRAPQSPLLVAHWRRGRVDVAAFVGGRYVFGNTLSCNTINEAIYHLVEVMKTRDMDDEALELQLCGLVDRHIYQACLPFFPKVTLLNGIDPDTQASEFINLHTYRHALILI